MSRDTTIHSNNFSDSDHKPALSPSITSSKPSFEPRKPGIKLHNMVERSPQVEITTKDKKKQAQSSPPTFSSRMRNLSAPSILRYQRANANQLLRSNLSLNASCSSDASSDSSHSRASTGRISRSSAPVRRKQGISKIDNVIEKVDGGVVVESDGSRKRCAWVTPYADPLYVQFHDEEWGVPVHDDSKLFELLSYAVALAELSLPTILNKRDIFSELFLDFNPASVSKLNEKKVCAPGSLGCTILSELKLRNIVENARQVCKVADEFGSFDKYIWGFMNHKPIVNKFRYPRQVPVKTSKADMISKDLVRRGFRGVGQTVIYSFMQAAGLTNDHLITCFRYQECVAAGDGIGKQDPKHPKLEDEKPVDIVKQELARALDEMSTFSDS